MAAPPLDIKLFGVFSLHVGGAEVGGVPEPAQELLTRLALDGGRGLERAAMSSAIWPAADPERARFYLRRCLSTLRVLFGCERGRLGGLGDRRISLDLTDCRCDLARFETCIRRGDAGAMAEAADLVSGDLLVGHHSEWVHQTRENYRERAVGLLLGLAERSEKAEDFDHARTWLVRARSMDPLREDTCRRLMRVLGAKGDFPGIVKAYRDLKLTLRQELCLNPAPDTVNLYRELLSDAGLAGMVRSRAASLATTRMTGPPTPATPFVGREPELVDVASAVRGCRFVTIAGPGGIGKTRLAVECARILAASFPAGVSFADMSVCKGRDEVAERIACALGDCDDLEFQRVLKADAGAVLLVLDGVEHVVGECSEVVERLLHLSPDLHVLCTSQVALPSPDQRLYPLGPMRLPSPSLPAGDDLKRVEAVTFFLACAERAAPTFRFGPANWGDVAELCRRLDGLPLALTLAAVRLRTASIRDIVANLDDRFQLLDRANGSVDRRRTLEGVLDWSFQLLAPSERMLFVRLGAFHGSWTMDAAQSVCSDANLNSDEIPALLASLVDHSLVTFDPTCGAGLYRMLETVASYARARLARQPEALNRLTGRHADYYLHVAEALHPDTLDLASFDEDEPNFSAALESFLSETSAERRSQALRMVNRLSPLWYRAFTLSRGLRTTLRVVDVLGEDRSELLVETLYHAAGAASCLFKVEPANNLFARAEAMADALGLESWATESLRGRGELAADEARPDEAEPLLRAALERFRMADDPLGEAKCLALLGYVERQRGRMGAARELTEASLAISVAHGDVMGRLWCMGSLAAGHIEAGEPERAIPLLVANLARQEEAGNVSGQVWNLTMLGIAKARCGELAPAHISLNRAMALLGDDPEDLRKAWQMMELGEIERRLGRLEEAELMLTASLRLSRVAGLTRLEAASLIRLCAVAIDRGDLASARAYRSAAERMPAVNKTVQLSQELDEVVGRIAVGSADS